MILKPYVIAIPQRRTSITAILLALAIPLTLILGWTFLSRQTLFLGSKNTRVVPTGVGSGVQPFESGPMVVTKEVVNMPTLARSTESEGNGVERTIPATSEYVSDVTVTEKPTVYSTPLVRKETVINTVENTRIVTMIVERTVIVNKDVVREVTRLVERIVEREVTRVVVVTREYTVTITPTMTRTETETVTVTQTVTSTITTTSTLTETVFPTETPTVTVTPTETETPTETPVIVYAYWGYLPFIEVP